MRRRAFLVTACLAIVVQTASARAADPPPPNILLIMADDYPWPFYGKMRSLANENPPGSIHPLVHPHFEFPIQTPGLDELANRGVFFPAGYSGAPVCHPSFQATLTGLYEKDFLKGRFERPATPSTYYIVEYLNDALVRHNKIKEDAIAQPPTPAVYYRYRSLGFGKSWTKGSFPAAGFDFGWKGKGPARGTIDPIIDFIKINSGAPQDAYDAFCAMKRAECPPINESDRPDPTQPWFIWYAPNLPHYPTDAQKRTDKRVNQESKCVGDNEISGCIQPPDTDVPDSLAYTTAYEDLLVNMQAVDDVQGGHGAYLRNILLLDYWVGHLIKAVQEHAPNTIIVYQADNGYVLPKSKRTNGENAFRTPIMISWPGRITPGVRDQLVSALDFIPTLVDYATDHTFPQCPPGISPVSHDAQGKPVAFSPAPPTTNCTGTGCGCFEGKSMRPFIDSPSDPGPNWIVGSTSGNSAYLRTRDGWRLTRSESCKFKLFDLRGDPSAQPPVMPDNDETNNCLSSSSAPCREDFKGLDYASGNCVPTAGSRCAQVKQWQCALKQWYNPGNKCTFSCN
jgi:uncharacterized sulfatase